MPAGSGRPVRALFPVLLAQVWRHVKGAHHDVIVVVQVRASLLLRTVALRTRRAARCRSRGDFRIDGGPGALRVGLRAQSGELESMMLGRAVQCG